MAWFIIAVTVVALIKVSGLARMRVPVQIAVSSSEV